MAIIGIDVVKYIKKVAKLLGIDEDLVRNEADIAAAIKKLMPVLENATAGKPGGVAPPGLGALTGGIPQ
jgi:hypothetical protein